jgi:hypothetical protein
LSGWHPCVDPSLHRLVLRSLTHFSCTHQGNNHACQKTLDAQNARRQASRNDTVPSRKAQPARAAAPPHAAPVWRHLAEVPSRSVSSLDEGSPRDGALNLLDLPATQLPCQLAPGLFSWRVPPELVAQWTADALQQAAVMRSGSF